MADWLSIGDSVFLYFSAVLNWLGHYAGWRTNHHFVLVKKINGGSLMYYITLSISWAAIAIVFDYIFIVKAIKPSDGYFKPDVYLYYVLTFILPLIFGWRRKAKPGGKAAG